MNRCNYKKETYCEYGEYIDNEYICKATGKVCSFPVPNQYECYKYELVKKDGGYSK